MRQGREGCHIGGAHECCKGPGHMLYNTPWGDPKRGIRELWHLSTTSHQALAEGCWGPGVIHTQNFWPVPYQGLSWLGQPGKALRHQQWETMQSDLLAQERREVGPGGAPACLLQTNRMNELQSK